MGVASLNGLPAVIRFFCACPYVFFGAIASLFFALRYALTESRRDLRMLSCAIIPPLAGSLCMWAANAGGALSHARYDLYVDKIDGLFGFHPSFALGRVLLAHVWSLCVLNFSYGFLCAAVTLVLMAYAWRPNRLLREVATTFILNAVIAAVLYLIFPVSGPRFAFSSFPHHPTTVDAHIIYLSAAPNGVPSVHCSTALLIWWHSRRWRLGRIAASIHLLGVLISTLATGQHYLFDLIVAFPYAALIVYLTRSLLHPAAAVTRSSAEAQFAEA